MAYYVNYGDILGTPFENLNGGWSLDIIRDRETFPATNNCLNVAGQKVRVIVTGIIPT